MLEVGFLQCKSFLSKQKAYLNNKLLYRFVNVYIYIYIHTHTHTYINYILIHKLISLGHSVL